MNAASHVNVISVTIDQIGAVHVGLAETLGEATRLPPIAAATPTISGMPKRRAMAKVRPCR